MDRELQLQAGLPSLLDLHWPNSSPAPRSWQSAQKCLAAPYHRQMGLPPPIYFPHTFCGYWPCARPGASPPRLSPTGEDSQDVSGEQQKTACGRCFVESERAPDLIEPESRWQWKKVFS